MTIDYGGSVISLCPDPIAYLQHFSQDLIDVTIIERTRRHSNLWFGLRADKAVRLPDSRFSNQGKSRLTSERGPRSH